MQGDFSRKTFHRTKHYSGVLVQQGRVHLDADLNEQLAIHRHHEVTEMEDVIGACGAPKYEAGFQVVPAPDNTDLLIRPGRYYVHGRLCELEGTPLAATFVSTIQVTVARWWVDGGEFAPHQFVELAATSVAPAVFRVKTADAATRRLTFTSSIAAFQGAVGLTVRRLAAYLMQPDLPDPPFLTLPDPAGPPVLDIPDGIYLIYLDVWQRHVTSLVDELLREKALGGPDTTTRLKTVWQVKLWPGPGQGLDPLPDDVTCESDVPGWNALTAAPTGRLSARTKPGEEPGPCILPPGAGYLGLENQLYRVEIHRGGTLGTDPLSFKWSRDNASVVKPIVKIPNSPNFTVPEKGPDDVFELANGQWMEQIDDAVDLNAVARDLFQFQRDPVTGAVTLLHPVDTTRHPQLRRWDSDGEVVIPSPPINDGWIDLENGIQVRFDAGTYRTGDYWLIPARTALGDIEWPRDTAGEALARQRLGIRHHCCRLGVLHVDDSTLTVEDCRPVFPPLTELKSTSSCCTFTVGDGVKYVGDFTTIQEAVNHLPADGGEICILPGTYTEAIEIKGRKNVHLKGCGPRTRIVLPAGSTAPAVVHILASEGVALESLAVEAAGAAAGILADGDPQNRRLGLTRLSVKAVQKSAILINGAEDVTIERCRVEMTDANGAWPGIFLVATDSSVHENTVVGTLLGMTAPQIFTLKGSLAGSAIQLGGGCERIRVHNNLLQGCSGQGITLGSLIQVGADGEPVDPGGGLIGWVGDATDPCRDCDDPTTGDRPPGDVGGDEPPTRLQSAGDLYDIDIRRNRILDMGLDGIGVIHFFDLRQSRLYGGLVRVQDLAIVDNRIERCVRRAFAPIPVTMLDLMAYGGISLSMAEGLVIRDNRIEDIGVGGLLPVCGIFVLYGEGVEIARNHVLNPGLAKRAADAPVPPGRRGGIHVVYARTLASAAGSQAAAPTEGAVLGVAGAPGGIRVVDVAVVVEENTVDVVAGQALALGALGPVSCVANRLISRGLVVPDLTALLQSGGAGILMNPFTHFASLVSIATLGTPGSGPANLAAGAAGVGTRGTLATAPRPAFNTNVLFDDNQCLLTLGRRSTQASGPLASLLLPAILIMNLDDLGFQDNQCDCVLEDGIMPAATVLLGLVSVRTVSNRFKETLGKALFSAVTWGIMNMTAHNQANHCLKALGFLLQDQPNHELVTIFQKNFCAAAERNLVAQLGILVG